MTDDELLRYSRQILLPDLGIGGQERLRGSRVLIAGLGGLGSPVALYLAAAGVGQLILADCDAVDLSNLQRQVLHSSERIGMPKAESAHLALKAINPGVDLVLVKRSLDPASLSALVPGLDLVVDASDNFATRFAINTACAQAGVPLVSGAAIGLEGQVSCFPGTAGGPCYECVYPREGAQDTGCSASGVLAPVVGIIGSLQATEAIKILTGIGEPLFGRLLLLDASRMAWRSVRIASDPACPICGSGSGVPASSPFTAG